MPERRRKKILADTGPIPVAEVAESFTEFRRSETRLVSVPRLYCVDGNGKAHTLYFQLERPNVMRSDVVVKAAIRDIGASGMATGISVRLQVGEEVRLLARDVVSDALLFSQDYVVRSLRPSRNVQDELKYVAGMQLQAGSGALLLKSYLSSIHIKHLLEGRQTADAVALLGRLFPGYQPGGARKPAGPNRGNVQISLNVGSIQRPAAKPVQIAAVQAQSVPVAPAPAPAPVKEDELILVAGVGGSACRAAQALNGLCFSEFEVPELPLEPCTQKHACNCALQSFSERREASRRDEADRRGESADDGRRLGIDRRQSP